MEKPKGALKKRYKKVTPIIYSLAKGTFLKSADGGTHWRKGESG
jgi:hypothetical protein